VLTVPPPAILEQTYPDLCPKARSKVAGVSGGSMIQASAQRAPAGSRVYVVEEGDTLFDIARYELGKASRWGEIYDLNRESLGEDFDYLQPGTQLVLPGGGPAATDSPDSMTRNPAAPYRR
jgi:nucleoid-associated protein YgaU